MAGFTPHTELEVLEMLEEIGVKKISDLFVDIPAELAPQSFNIPSGLSEMEAIMRLKGIAARNKTEALCFAGGGYYDHYIPSAVDALSNRAEFYTAYTPYQPEASQGTLQAIFEYQTMIAHLAGMDVSNASLYDGGTALYEAVAMALRTNNRKKILVCKGVNPLFRNIVTTYLTPSDVELIEVDVADFHTDKKAMTQLLSDDISAIVLQSPNFFGMIDDHSGLFALAREKKITTIAVFNPSLMGILKTPGESHADIAVAEGQPLGLPLSFGGPYLGILAASKGYVRKMPGRIVGETVDKHGKRCYVLTLQAREQHIRREKATSNICSNQALCALRAAIYLSLMGHDGLVNLATLLAAKGDYLKKGLSAIGKIKPGYTMHEFTVKLPCNAATFAEKMSQQGILAGIPASLHYKGMENHLIIAVTEKRTEKEMDHYISTATRIIKGDLA